MRHLLWLGLLVSSLVACEERVPTPAVATIPAPFTERDNVVPVALDPNRPQPPPPSMLEVARDQERVPPVATQPADPAP